MSTTTDHSSTDHTASNGDGADNGNAETTSRRPDASRTEGRSATRPEPKELDRVVIRFAGDSGDGMQLTGSRFTTVSSLFGNDT
ncbi:MAG: hypothetical protein ACLP6E_07105, partial [Acidimicrobiales bacterium]